jgi:hypothetical protein
MKYIIYKITIADYTYIGSTKDFNQRKTQHKSTCKTDQSQLYQLIREAGGWDKCEMTPIEEYEGEGQLQARIREEYWRREYNANMNSRRAYRTEDERAEDCIKSHKAYIEANEEKIKTIHKCDCGGKYTYLNIRRHEKGKKHLAYLENQNLTIL